MLNVRLEGEVNVPPIENISIAKEGNHYYVLEGKDTIPSCMVAQVKWKRGYKTVTFRSTYVIRNTTPYPIEMAIYNKGDKEMAELHISKISKEKNKTKQNKTKQNKTKQNKTKQNKNDKEPGEEGAVPLHLVFNTVIRFRPEDITTHHTFDWSKDFIYWKDITKKPIKGLLCPCLVCNSFSPLYDFY